MQQATTQQATGNYSTGNFSTEDFSGFGAFNKNCTLDEWNSAKKPNFIHFDLTVWVPAEEMTEEEKEQNPSYKTTGGYLKTYGYEEAWKRACERQERLENQKGNVEMLKSIQKLASKGN